MKGLLIVSHGSRSKDAVNEFNQLIEMVRTQAAGFEVGGAHMELATPDIPTMVASMVEKGVTNFTVVPYFLFNGNHIKQDIPEIIDGEKEKYPEVSFTLSSPIGAEPLMVGILLKRAGL